jgi:hypothetical protein
VCFPLFVFILKKGGNVSAILGGHNVWARALSDGSVAAAFFNAHPLRTMDIAVSVSVLPGMSASTPVRVRDLWLHRELGNATGTIVAPKVAPGGCSVYRIWQI